MSASIDPRFAKGAASKRIKEAERRLFGDPPKEAGHAEAPGQSGEVAQKGPGRAEDATRMGESQDGRKRKGCHGAHPSGAKNPPW